MTATGCWLACLSGSSLCPLRLCGGFALLTIINSAAPIFSVSLRLGGCEGSRSVALVVYGGLWWLFYYFSLSYNEVRTTWRENQGRALCHERWERGNGRLLFFSGLRRDPTTSTLQPDPTTLQPYNPTTLQPEATTQPYWRETFTLNWETFEAVSALIKSKPVKVFVSPAERTSEYSRSSSITKPSES